MSLYRPLEAPPGQLRFKLLRARQPLPLSQSLPMLEHMGVQVLEERPYRGRRREGARADLDRTTSACSAPGDAEIDVDALRAAVRGSVRRASGAARSRTTTSTAWSCAPRLAGARWWCCAPTRKYMRQIGVHASPGLHRADAGGASRHRAPSWSTLFRAALRPAPARRPRRARGRDRSAHRGRAREGREPRRGPRAAPVPGADPGHAAHQLLAARRGGPAAKPFLSFKFDPSQGARPARAQADVRDLRLLAALRRRAPARRQGRARRPALVGPAGGLPHRGAGPGEGADGEERRHRAGRLQGRLRAEARAAGQRPRGLHEGRRGLLPGLPARPARPHRQPGRRQGRAAAGRGAPRRRRSVPGRRRRQGHRDLLRLSPTAISAEYGFWLGDAFASGGSVGYDHKKMGITARGAWESVKRHFREIGRRHADDRTSPSSASATCRATCSATACCCRGTSGWWRRSTTATSSSTRTPTPQASFAERERLFELPRSSWADYDAKLISAGGGVLAAQRQVDPALARGARGAGHRRPIER